jgi:hypothetical protein
MENKFFTNSQSYPNLTCSLNMAFSTIKKWTHSITNHFITYVQFFHDFIKVHVCQLPFMHDSFLHSNASSLCVGFLKKIGVKIGSRLIK